MRIEQFFNMSVSDLSMFQDPASWMLLGLVWWWDSFYDWLGYIPWLLINLLVYFGGVFILSMSFQLWLWFLWAHHNCAILEVHFHAHVLYSSPLFPGYFLRSFPSWRQNWLIMNFGLFVLPMSSSTTGYFLNKDLALF